MSTIFIKPTLITAILLAAAASCFAVDPLAETPPMGWNSWDSYSRWINEQTVRRELVAFIEKLHPVGYEYFVIDDGWFLEGDLPSDGSFPVHKPAELHLRLDEFGRPLPSRTLFPNGLKPLIDQAHQHGVKFGVWIIRGVPRQAVARKLPVKNTAYTAADIADPCSLCSWCDYNYGIDMTQPAAHAYYDSIFELLAEWGVDFVKYDDIVDFSAEVRGVDHARRHCGRDILLSLSPGGRADPAFVDSLKRAEMVRITSDVWDNRESLEKGFFRWERWAQLGGEFWIDLDMIPFGHLKVWDVERAGREQWAKKGYARHDLFTQSQRETFLAQRALAASPLFMGGALTTTRPEIIALITDPDMIACNQNGVTGHLVDRFGAVDTWRTRHRSKDDCGWIGVFNRRPTPLEITLQKEQTGLDPLLSYQLYDIWRKRLIADRDTFRFSISSDGVVFLRYTNE